MKKEHIITPQPGGRYGLSDWHTHIPLLVSVLTRLRPLRILELGSGDYSTTILNAYARGTPGALCVSLENHTEWCAGGQWMSGDEHQIIQVGEWDYAAFPGPWDFVFIDHNPETLARVPALKFYLEQNAGVVLMHDCNYPDRYQETLSKFNYVLHDRRHRFHTTLASNAHDVTTWF